MLEHSSNSTCEQLSAGWKSWLLATDQKGGGCAAQEMQLLDVMREVWPQSQLWLAKCFLAQ